jgi:hypothetical protein
VASLEHALDLQFLDTDVYPVSFVPVDLRAGDALLIGAVSVLMCVLAAVYPALRAARLQPARRSCTWIAVARRRRPAPPLPGHAPAATGR